MATQSNATIVKLSDTGQTVADPAGDIRGRKVKDKDGVHIGDVHDLLVDDQEHKVRFLLVEHGGFLGVGETKSFIPVDAITKITDDAVLIDHSGEHVVGAPPYAPELVGDRSYQANIYGYYGYLPFWS